MSKKYEVPSTIKPRNQADLENQSGNIYDSINILAKRANQISAQIKEELYGKLNEFATSAEPLEEIHENKEQIEISKYYERLPHPTLSAFAEFMNGKLVVRRRNADTLGDVADTVEEEDGNPKQ